MKGLLMTYDEESKEYLTVGKVSDFKATPESESDDSQAARRLDPWAWECSLTLNCKISGYALRAITGTESNNDRRRHHVPMRKRRGGSLCSW